MRKDSVLILSKGNQKDVFLYDSDTDSLFMNSKKAYKGLGGSQIFFFMAIKFFADGIGWIPIEDVIELYPKETKKMMKNHVTKQDFVVAMDGIKQEARNLLKENKNEHSQSQDSQNH